ncbi:hypothetical protein C1H46_013136 [Malus baccata]|uniref:Uncharacterized protein n=1 Tax=Malus baccata TaxID=106549 RepID=A0A540MR06_MALBA|nr:hypothetical protein C1H46_013136 [Malus baccata]
MDTGCKSFSLILKTWLCNTHPSFVVFLRHRPTDLGNSISSNDPALSSSRSSVHAFFSFDETNSMLRRTSSIISRISFWHGI